MGTLFARLRKSSPDRSQFCGKKLKLAEFSEPFSQYNADGAEAIELNLGVTVSGDVRIVVSHAHTILG